MSSAPGPLTIVIPVFNEEECLPHTHTRLLSTCRELLSTHRCSTVELIYVDDGSQDRTPLVLESLPRHEGSSIRVRSISFSRNFGHSAAVLAGLELATGSVIAIIDADLQDPPELLAPMLARLEKEQLDVVYGQRIAREGESPFKRFTAWAFYRLINLLAGIEIPKDTGDFRVMTRPVLESLLKCQEREPFLRGLVAWIGYRQAAHPYTRAARELGSTKYPFRKMLRFAGIAIVSFSSKPLRLALYVGVLGILFSLTLAAWALVGAYTGKVIPGWASLMLGYSLGQSMTLLLVGVLGIYIGRIHEESLARPRYIIRSRRD